MKKAIIFDMGGVLVDLDIEGCKDSFRKNLEYHDIDRIIDPCHQKGIWGDLEEGLLEADEFRRIILADSCPGAGPQDVDEAMARILVGISPYKAELLKRMSAGYDLYMLSNNNSICLPYSSAMFTNAGIPLSDIFRKCFFSFEMKALKPSREFYKRVMEEIGGPAENMLFIDDSRTNVDGAVAAGLPAVYYEPGTDLSALLSDVLCDPSLKMEVR
ncbi:MAG: HAD-IA family hydrolase [Bacteroidales bacterium]|nr:HAD-IA family hydrolase [Bacteroidales bacterium]MBQ9723331.1 HAD-IA family hydrolase [Bacteroidales bacterium]